MNRLDTLSQPLFQEVPVGPTVNIPLGAPPAWHRVVEVRAGFQCECAGQCGVAHKTGRCQVKHQGWHNKRTAVLVLAPKPAGLLLPLSAKALLPDAEQMAWCGKCLSAAEKLAALPT